MGSGTTIGRRLTRSAAIDAITLTGSRETGRTVAIDCAPNLTRLQLELGSKNALAVLDDADLDLAVEHAINGAFSGSGQKCTASSRLVVHRAVHDEFVERFVRSMKTLRVGHALHDDTRIGPLVDEHQHRGAVDYVALGRDEGATLVAGGEVPERPNRGWYFTPALFVDSDNAMRINQEEMFCPIACVMAVDSYEEALAVVNDTPYGLTAGIATRSLARATHFRRNVQTGCVMVNLPTAGTDYHVPFGGRKDSSHGPREQGRAAVEFYTVMKTAYIHAGAPH
jgi:aldehyde dehydrogenase (NAD+)